MFARPQVEMPIPTSSQKGRLSPCPRRAAPNTITAANPQAMICRRFARKDPVVEVPSVAASNRCSVTMTAAKIRGFRGIPRRTFVFRLVFLLEFILGKCLHAFAKGFFQCVLADNG